MLTVYAVFCGLLIFVGIVLLCQSLPYTTNKYHRKVVSHRVFFSERIPAYIFLEMKTLDAFTANNPIDIFVTTTNIDRNHTRGIQLTFDGAERGILKHIEPPSSPPIGSSEDAWEEYRKSWEEYRKKFDEMIKETTGNLLNLQNDTKREWTSFSGHIQNVTYSSGGGFDIGLTINRVKGGVVGYEMGDRECAIKEAIEVSPPEVLIQIENTYTMRGLAWIAVSIPFLIAGLNGLVELVRRYVIP